MPDSEMSAEERLAFMLGLKGTGMELTAINFALTTARQQGIEKAAELADGLHYKTSMTGKYECYTRDVGFAIRALSKKKDMADE